jgi:hypothetical protein
MKSTVATFPYKSPVSVRESLSAFSDLKVDCSIVYIRSNFGGLPASIKRLGTQGLPLQESIEIMRNASEKLSAVKGEAGESVSTKFQAVLKINLIF